MVVAPAPCADHIELRNRIASIGQTLPDLEQEDMVLTWFDGAEADETIGADWAAAITYQGEFGPLNLFVNGTYGDFDGGDVYGVVVMPSMFLVEEKLEAVVRYQWAHSTGDQLRLQSRNVRNVYRRDGVADLRGDDHHSIYAGLNYYVCDHNLKLMAGVEYETLDGPAVDTEATTLWGAVRFYF